MTITKVIKDLIETNTYNQIVSNIGNTQPVTIGSVVFANVTFANTSNTSIPTTGGYLKVFGTNFQANSNVTFDNTISSNVTFISSNEIRVTTPSLKTGTYSLFLYNPDGSNAIKYKFITVQGDNNFGYTLGGVSTSPTVLSSVERVNFSNDTNNTDTRGNLDVGAALNSSTRNNQHGYLFSGYYGNSGNPTPTADGSVKRITFNNDTSVGLARSSSISGATGSNVQNPTYSWHAGATPFGGGAAGVSSIYRFLFSSDTSAATLRTNMSIGRTSLSSVSDNSNYGWFAGGSIAISFTNTSSPPTTYTNTLYSVIDRLDFNSDTNVAIVRGSLSTNRASFSSTYNSNYGWFAAGLLTYGYAGTPTFHNFTSSSSIQRLNFSNDVSTTLTRGNSFNNSHYSSFGDENYGWYAGGFNLTPGQISNSSQFLLSSSFDSSTTTTIVRLIYATDTTAAASRSSLSVIRRGQSGISGLVT